MIRGLLINFDRPYYLKNASGGSIIFASDSQPKRELLLGKEQNALLSFDEGNIKVALPIVRWFIEPQGDDEEEILRTIWYGKFSKDSRIIVSCPNNVSCKINLGENALDYMMTASGEIIFDLGRRVLKMATSVYGELQPVELIVEYMSEVSRVEIFNIRFHETYEVPPQFEMTNRVLSVRNPYAFVGPEDAILEYHFQGSKGDASFKVCAGESVITDSCFFEDGKYQYTISGIPDNYFTTRNQIYSGSTVLGDVNVFRFDKKVLEIKKVRVGFRDFVIMPIFIERLEFVGTGVRYNDGIRYPIYQGQCFYRNYKDEKVPFADKAQEHYGKRKSYKVNPIQVVFINDGEICLHTQSGDGLYLMFDSEFRITDIEYNEYNRSRYYNPEFYEYSVVGEE
jgi:hypothetical protein